MKELGKILKKARLETGLTQIELSRMAGLSLKEVQKIEWGKANPTLRTLAKFASKLSGASFKLGSKQTTVKVFITRGKLPERRAWMWNGDKAAIAKITGLGESSLYRLCQGKRSNPTAKTLDKLGVGLGIRFIIN